MYFNGKGGGKDLAEAARLYRLAADQGDAVTQMRSSTWKSQK
jgi:TPR repeat protein